MSESTKFTSCLSFCSHMLCLDPKTLCSISPTNFLIKEKFQKPLHRCRHRSDLWFLNFWSVLEGKTIQTSHRAASWKQFNVEVLQFSGIHTNQNEMLTFCELKVCLLRNVTSNSSIQITILSSFQVFFLVHARYLSCLCSYILVTIYPVLVQVIFSLRIFLA